MYGFLYGFFQKSFGHPESRKERERTKKGRKVRKELIRVGR